MEIFDWTIFVRLAALVITLTAGRRLVTSVSLRGLLQLETTVNAHLGHCERVQSSPGLFCWYFTSSGCTSQGALKEGAKEMQFLDKTVEVDKNAGIFVTLNPAGATWGAEVAGGCVVLVCVHFLICSWK